MNGKGDIRPRKRKEKESRKDDDDFTRVLNARATAAHLRNLALREVQKTPNQNLKIRKLARTVLETVFSKKDRGAGSWSELAVSPRLILLPPGIVGKKEIVGTETNEKVFLLFYLNDSFCPVGA